MRGFIVAVIVIFSALLFMGQIVSSVFSWQIDPILGDVITVSFGRSVNFFSRFLFEKSIRFDPKINGFWVWKDNFSAFFVPEYLESDTRYSLYSSIPLFAGILNKEQPNYAFTVPSLTPIKPKLLPEIEKGFKRKDGRVVVFNQSVLHEKYIDIDLQKNIVTLFESSGKRTAVFDVLASGKPYFWKTKGGVILGPTPKGKFKIQYKAPKQFSNLSQVWMPWAMHFYGNYYLHGVPYFLDGRKYIGQYSGGCVRFEDKVAQEIYSFADLGTTVLIH